MEGLALRDLVLVVREGQVGAPRVDVQPRPENQAGGGVSESPRPRPGWGPHPRMLPGWGLLPTVAGGLGTPPQLPTWRWWNIQCASRADRDPRVRPRTAPEAGLPSRAQSRWGGACQSLLRGHGPRRGGGRDREAPGTPRWDREAQPGPPAAPTCLLGRPGPCRAQLAITLPPGTHVEVDVACDGDTGVGGGARPSAQDCPLPAPLPRAPAAL